MTDARGTSHETGMTGEGEAMTGPGTETAPLEERLRAELRRLREQVVGVHGSLIATSDGFLVAHDTDAEEPSQLAALVATTLGLARQTTQATGRGRFREAVVRGEDGYLAVYALGETAILAVIGGEDLNVGMLHYQTRDAAKRMTVLLAGSSWSRYGHNLPYGSFGHR